MLTAKFKLLFILAVSFVTASILPVNPCGEKSAEVRRNSSVPSYLERGREVQEHYNLYSQRLTRYYQSLAAALKVNRPELLGLLDRPTVPRRNDRLLPEIASAGLAPQLFPAGQSSYSWPWTDKMIGSAANEIAGAQEQLALASEIPLEKGLYEKLALDYEAIRERQKTIERQIQYNRFWQATIAANRENYDRETALYDKIIELHAITWALHAIDTLSLNPWPAAGFRIAQRLIDMTGLRDREKLLRNVIGDVTDAITVPTFVRLEHRRRHLWIVHVPFYTDIIDREFVNYVKESIEENWQLRDGEDQFQAELAITPVSISGVDDNGQRTRRENGADGSKRLDLFPRDGAILTNGGLTTHVYGHAIILGPDDVTPGVLAHEFGHILGFRDSYFRGYKNLGINGFEIMEAVADSNDIMGAPETGRVLPRHFRRILQALIKVGKKNG